MIAVLIVSLVLLSTQLYIYDVGRPLESGESGVNNFLYAVKLGSKHLVTGSLANVSTDHNNTILTTKLEGWKSFIEGLSQFGKPILVFTLQNTSPYTNGTHLSWVADGFGISSACAGFNFSLFDGQVSVQSFYVVNVTTSLEVKGVWRALTEDLKQVNVTCNLLNEGAPALAEDLAVLFESSGSWQRADEQSNYSLVDYGNGTYLVSFDANIPGASASVSAQVYDMRDIYVQANTTCSNV